MKMICFSPKAPIQLVRPKSYLAPPGAQFMPKHANQKVIPVQAGALSALGSKSALGNWIALALI